MDCRGVVTTLATHDASGLAGKGSEQNLALDAFGNVLGERGLSRAGIAEQTEDRRPTRGVPAPIGDRLQCGFLLRSEGGHAACVMLVPRRQYKEQSTNSCQRDTLD